MTPSEIVRRMKLWKLKRDVANARNPFADYSEADHIWLLHKFDQYKRIDSAAKAMKIRVSRISSQIPHAEQNN